MSLIFILIYIYSMSYVEKKERKKSSYIDAARASVIDEPKNKQRGFKALKQHKSVSGAAPELDRDV